MTKLTDEDVSLWNLYKSKLKTITKKIDNYNINNLLKDKKTLNISNQDFFLEEKTIKLLKKNQIKIDKALDLHGLTEIEAKECVNEFVFNSFKNKQRNLVIITGKGINNKGILKRKTPTWLHNEEISKFIVGFTSMPKSAGGDGAIFIKLKNRNKYIKD